MAEFPKLKTGAVAQYPSSREARLRNDSVRFLDGTFQRYRDAGAIERRWVIQLELLDEGEMAALEEFFVSMEGAFGEFTFNDPWDGQPYEHCRIGDEATFISAGEMQGSTTLTVTQ